MNNIAQSLRRKTEDGKRKTENGRQKTKIRPLSSVLRPLSSVLRPLSSVRGVVLIAVLWICALVMWFAFQISAQTRLLGEDRMHSIRDSQALYLALGGCYEALARMGQAPALRKDQSIDLNWQPDGQPRTVRYDSGIAVVVIEPEETKVNVNSAQKVQLRQVLQNAGADELTSEKLADRILDFINADAIPRPQGMEKADYIKAGLNYIPFNGPLTDLDQLLLVPGVSQQLFYGYGNGTDEGMGESQGSCQDIVVPAPNSLFSLLTIYGGNTNSSPGLGGQQASVFKFWRPGGIYRILSFGKSANGPPSAGVWLTVRYTSSGEKPYQILSRKVM